jgi:signal transduction histidine kinase
LSNLVDNAIKFTPDGGRIRLVARGEAPDGPNALLLSVSDSGPGIPLEAQGRIFEKFKQAGNTPGRRRGTGLGLAFCRLAAEAHGGRIWVESIPGHGATFTIALPLEP